MPVLHPAESPITVAIEARRCAGRVFYVGVALITVETRGEIELRTDVCADEEHARCCLVDLARALYDSEGGNRAREVVDALAELPCAPTHYLGANRGEVA